MRLAEALRCASVVLVFACGGDDAPGTPDGAGECRDDCVDGWWSVATGTCTAFCSLSPAPRECALSDCEQLEAHELAASGTHSYLRMTHSPSAQQFTLILIAPDESWEVAERCELTLGAGAPSSFTCTAEGDLAFATRTWSRPSAAMETTLENARATGQGEYSY